MPDPRATTEPSAAEPQARRTWIWVQVAAAWVLWGTISVLRLGGSPFLTWEQAFWYGFPDALIWAAMTPLLVVVAHRFPVIGDRPWRSVAFHLLCAMGFALLHAALDASFASTRAFLGGSTESQWLYVFLKVIYHGYHTNLLIYILVVGLVQYVDRARRAAEQQRRAARLEAELTAARLEGLERQLRPHFLFNALNTISGTIGRDPETGRRVVRLLGDLLRASLKDPGRQITLREELDLVETYLEIERARFEDRLKIEIDADPSLDNVRVPALLLQPLVENAVRHGISQLPDGGTVRVTARQEKSSMLLTVEDDGPGFKGQDSSAEVGGGIGLNNTRRRLATLYGPGKHLRLEPSSGDSAQTGQGLRATIQIPVGPEAEISP